MNTLTRRVLSFAAAALALALLWGLDQYLQANARTYLWWPTLRQILVRIGIWTTLAVSLNLINGITGQFSLGHMGFAAVGGYTAAVLTQHLAAGGVGSAPVFLVSLVAGGMLAGVAGLLVGLPTLRLRGDYLAIATLGFGEIVKVVIYNVPALGGAAGLKGIPLLTDLFWVYAWALVTIVVVRNIRYSRQGRALLAIREDEVAAEAMGVNTVRYKVVAFSIGAFFAGVAGGLLGHFYRILDPNQFGFLNSIEVVIMVVVGGLGSIAGAAAAAAGLTYLSEALRAAGSIRMILYSAMLILVMMPWWNAVGGADAARGRRLLCGKCGVLGDAGAAACAQCGSAFRPAGLLWTCIVGLALCAYWVFGSASGESATLAVSSMCIGIVGLQALRGLLRGSRAAWSAVQWVWGFAILQAVVWAGSGQAPRADIAVGTALGRILVGVWLWRTLRSEPVRAYCSWRGSP